MRKRGARHSGQRGHVLTPHQVQQLVMPIHVALEMLPLGLYTQQHAHDLAAFVNIAQFAADEAGRKDIHDHAYQTAVILLRMRDRPSWNVTSAERSDLQRHILAIDKWMRGVSSTRWARAIRRSLAAIDRAKARGLREMDCIDVDRLNA